VASVENHLSIVDYGVVVTFEQKYCSHCNGWNPMLAFVEHVGWIEKIL
jgi:hypothetical protein